MTKDEAYNYAQSKIVNAADMLMQARSILEPYDKDNDTHQVLALISPSAVLRAISYMKPAGDS